MISKETKSNLVSFGTQAAQTGAAVAMGAAASAAEKIFAAGFKRMKLKSYSLIVQPGGSVQKEAKDAIEVIVNPESYKRTYAPPDPVFAAEKRYRQYLLADGKVRVTKVVQFSEDISFDLWYDSTGIFPKCEDVDTSISELQEYLADYDGEIHSTRYVQIMWGDLNFMGQLTSLSIDYLYFNRDGKPLRAKVEMKFSKLVDEELQKYLEDDQSPDLTHSRIVKDGDTLPLMCYRIYHDPFYYPQVAAANGLAHFTDLKPGQRIFFPPLDR